MNKELLLHTEFTFDSAHHLEKYNGKCSEVHGHSWLCEIWIKGHKTYLDEVGILVDFGIVKKLKEMLDHKNINNVLDCNPTAENLSMWVYDKMRNEVNNVDINIKVRIYESYIDKKAWCEFGDF
jgi:6-pyruvoyltetrahydropterin/6-carboxytetrahydropterin synthase